MNEICCIMCVLGGSSSLFKDLDWEMDGPRFKSKMDQVREMV